MAVHICVTLSFGSFFFCFRRLKKSDLCFEISLEILFVPYIFFSFFFSSFTYFVQQCLLKSCREIQQKDPKAKSGARTIQPLPNAKPTKVYCEFDIAGGGFTFLPHSLTFRSDAQKIVDSLFKDKRNVLLKLKTRVNGSESYTWIQPHPNFIKKDFGVLVNNFSGYTTPLNRDMGKYIFLRILPKSIAKKSYEMQRFKSNGKITQFENCGWNPNSLFAFLLNPNGRTCKSYASNLRCKEKDDAAQWRSTAKPVTFPELKMPQEFFFLTELHFGGGGCYISNDRYFRFNATAIGIR